MSETTKPRFIETTVGQIDAALAQHNIAPDQKIRVNIMGTESDNWMDEIRKETRPWVIAKGWTDDDIDRIIDEAREEVQHLLPRD